jgi:nicotinate-nucleotide adenylyltransferase
VPDAPASTAGLARGGSLGILGGTFNPPHLGHLAIAVHACSELSLERVVLMPARIPPHKTVERDPGGEHRLAMCRLLLQDELGLSVCALELERDGPSYTVDTLRAIHSSHPQAELTFIVGADIASTLPAWREPQELLELAGLAVAARPGSDRRGVLDALEPLGDPARVRFLDAPLLDISSSRARARVVAGEPIESLVGPAVASYIAEHELYDTRARAVS